jgi:hypothetical protein
VVHHDRVTYLVQPGPDTLPLGGQKARVFQWEDEAERDEARLASKKLTIRQKERIRAAAAARPSAPESTSDRLAGVLWYLREFEAEQKASTSDRTAERRSGARRRRSGAARS